MPDMIIHDGKNGWLFVIGAVTSHGPIEPRRRMELDRIFSKPGIGIVYVTAFLDHASLAKFVRQIAWETNAWIAESPDHT